MTEQQKGRVCLTVDFSPHHPFTLVSSSHAYALSSIAFSYPRLHFRGDILSWNLREKAPTHRRYATGHSRSVFNLQHSPSDPRFLISISMDRMVSRKLKGGLCLLFSNR